MDYFIIKNLSFPFKSYSSVTFLVHSFHVDADLDDGGKVLSTDVVLCLHVQVTQLTGADRVVLGVELIETLEGLSSLQRNNEKRRALDHGRSPPPMFATGV